MIHPSIDHDLITLDTAEYPFDNWILSFKPNFIVILDYQILNRYKKCHIPSILNDITFKRTKKKNRTPLHFALENNSKDMIELLLSKRADINGKDIIYLIIIILFLIKII